MAAGSGAASSVHPPREGGREFIFRTALTLFAARGYEQVPMRDLAAAAGLRASSIYHHFPAKDAILEHCVTVFRQELEARAVNRVIPEPGPGLSGDEARRLLCAIMLAPLSLLADPELADLVRVLTRGQFHNETIRRFLLEEMFERPRALLRQVLAGLSERGLLRPEDPDFLVAELQSPFGANFYHLSLHPRPPAIDLAATRQAMERHVAFFWRAAATPEECHETQGSRGS